MAKSLLDKFEEYKKLKQQEQEQAKAPKYTAPDTGSIVDRFESYKQQRQAEQQAAVSAKRINNPSHLGNVMKYSAVQNTQRKQAESARVAKEDETRRVKQEDTRLHMDTVNRLTQQYMPVRPDPMPRVDITKKYGPSSKQNTGRQWAGTTVTDAPVGFNTPGFTDLSDNGPSYKLSNEPIDEAERDRREREERDRSDRSAYEAALERANLRKPAMQAEPGGVNDLTAQRDQLLKEIETLDTVLKWPVGRQDVEGHRNFTNAQAQRPLAEKALTDVENRIKEQNKAAQQAEDAARVEALKAKYETAPDWEKGQVLAELKAAEYNRDWNAMNPLEQTGVWLGDRAKKALYTINDAVYAIPDLIADVAGIDRLQWSKNNKAALMDVQSNIEKQAKNTGWLVNAAGDVVSEGIRMIPTILIASMTGGASLAAQGAANIATAGAGTGAKVAQATAAMLKNPSFVNSFFNMFGLNLSQAREAGADPATAVSMSWQKALPSALIEMSGGYEKAAERGRGWLDWLIGSLEEGREEVIQGITDAAVDKTFGNMFNLSVDDVVSLTNQEAIVSGARAAEEFGLGAVTAGVMGGAQIGLLKGIDAITGNDPRRIETFPSDGSIELNKKIAENESKMAALEAAARERSENEARDSEARKQYDELVKLVNDNFEQDSETRALLAEDEPFTPAYVSKIANSAMQEVRAKMQENPESVKLSESITQTVGRIFKGFQDVRNATVEKYVSGLDEAVKSEIKGKTGDEAVAYAKGYGIAHALGQYGVSNDTIAKVTAFEDAKKAAEEGRAKWDIELPKAKNKADELRKTLPVPGKGSVTYHSNVKQDALTTGQRDQIALLEQVAKPMGYKFVMVEFEKDAAGNYVTDKGKIAPNGYFRDTDGTIYIDVNAGKTAGRMVEDTIIPQTAGHELTHYLKANAPDLFRAYGAAVIEELSAKGQDINALIAQKIGRAKQADIGVDAAVEELIADASSMMLQNTQAVQALAKTNPGLFQKITEWVKDFIERVRKAFSKVEGTPEAKAIMSMRDGVMKYADSLQKMWDDMAVSVAQARVKEEAERPSVEGIVRDGLNRYADEAAVASERYQERDDNGVLITDKYPNLNLNEDISSLDGVPAIRLIDGSILPAVGAPTHVNFITKNNIDVADVHSGGWISKGVYDPSFTSETSPYIQRELAKRRRDAGRGVQYQERDSDDAPLTAEQIEYFKDSKVRDAQGRLLKVYHGTKADFTTFRATDGAYFTASKKVADGFAGGAESGAYYLDFKTPLVLDAEGNRWDALTAPAEMGRSNAKYKMTPDEEAQYTEFRKLHEALQKLVDDGLSTNDYTKWHENNPRHGELQPSVTKIIQKQAAYEESNSSVIGAEDLVEWAKEQGKHDGVILKNVREGWASEIISDDYIALHSEQVKRIDNLTPTSSPDIRYQERDTQYLAAVESGDMDTTQKMVDEAAKAAGYTIKAYHGSPDGGFNIFEGFKYRSLIDKNINYDKSHSIADWFSSGVETPSRLYNVDNRDSVNGKQLYNVMLKLGNTLVVDAKRAAWNKILLSGDTLDGIRKYYPSYLNGETMKSEPKTIFTTEEIARYAKRSGYNAVEINNVSETGDTVNGPFETTYGVFNSNQVKSADPVTYDDAGNPVPLSQRFTDSNDIRYQERDPVPPMYSKMAQEIEAYKGDKMGADSVVKYLTGRGVKADEIRWSGIVPFLQGKKSVSKAELLEFARASALRVEDVTYGQDKSIKKWVEDNITLKYEKNEYILGIDDGDAFVDISSDGDSEYWHDNESGEDFDSWRDAYQYAKDRYEEHRDYWLNGGEDGNVKPTKFEGYSLDGGKYYRELLFTAPDLPGSFQSAHFDEKNVLAHTRLQDFQTPDGKPVLFIEEVQSDWHEKGREQGYKDSSKSDALKAKENEIRKELESLRKQKAEMWGVSTDNDMDVIAQKINELETNLQDAVSAANEARYSEMQGVAPAPFTTTWHEYVLKRVLRMAAEGGYDYVGWTTGQMQLDRYPLAKQLKRIEASRSFPNGVESLEVNLVGVDGKNQYRSFAMNEIVETFGKDLGNRIIEGTKGGKKTVIEEDGLTIGGEGMRNFYDIGGKSSQNIPRFLNKYGAQWGAKISTIDMQGAENTYQVPAIEVTDAMKESVLFDGQALYQERDPDYRTKRDILAGAFDSVAKTEGEKRNLKEYKNMIGALNRMEEEARGLRQANTAERKKPGRDKAVIEKNTKRIAEIEDRINNLDKRLLKMQNAAPLQNVLKREVDYYKKQQNMINRQQLEKYRAERAETSIKQRHRADITKGVKTLNTMLMNESDQKHIPEGFKGAVVDILRLFTDNTSVFDYKRLSVLKEMYDALETSDSELAGMYDFDIAGDIADAARMLEGKRLSQLTESELESLRDIVAHFNHIVKNENLIFTQKRSVKTTDAAEEGLSEYGKKAKEMRLAILNGKNPVAAINKFLTSKNVKPVYFFKRVGGILQELFDDIRAAQGKWAFRMAEDRNFFRNTVNKYNYYKWADDGQLTFTTARGDQITLTRDQALELYAINKREKTNKQQGAEHLAVGGFVYNDAVKVKKKSALGVPMTYEVNVGENHPLTDSDLNQISKWLTNEQRAFADEMVNYLSVVMGERGNEVSLALYGLRKYKEKYYFPYKSASNYLYSHQGGAQDDSAIKHRSFTKRTTVSANNPVVLTGFTKVWADHVQNMNLYNAMAVPLDNFNRVYNYRIRGDKDSTKAQSVKAALEAAYGKEANAYIKQLLNDVNGGIRPDKGDAEARKLMSLWKKGAVFASLSVVVQQPSAIGRALALVDPKYFRKGYTKAGYEEMMKWSGVANIKAMGRFDANMGMTAADWLTQREYTGMNEKAKAFAKDGSYRDDVLSWLPQKADEMTWTAMWEAVKRETASKHGNLIGSDAFMQKVADRFDEVVDYTQVYDSVLSRSEVMRSQSALAQMVTAFMAEPTTAYNMLLDAIANRKNKGMKNYVKPGRALGAFAVSVMLNSILKAMVTAGRDDDEKYTYLEKYLRKVSGGIADELNPLGLVPYGRDILSLWDGYDVERADMSLIGDLVDAVKKMGKADMPLMQKADTLAGAIGNALGIPYKNVRRDIQGVYNMLASSAPLSMQSASGVKYSLLEGLPWFDASKAGYARKLYSAITKGDAQEEAGLREQISKIVKKDTDINTELRKVITTEFEEERLEPREALQQMIELTGLKETKGKIGDWYKTGLITEDVAEQLLVEFTADDQSNERYKTIEGWNFSKNPENEGERYSTYKAFYEAIDSGKDLRAVVNTYMDPEKYGATKSTLSGRITDNYKEQYIEAYKRSKSEAAALKARLLNAYVVLGYDRGKKSKDIDAWLK